MALSKDLMACPFCHEMFAPGERTTCPHCGLELQPMSKLPLSYEARMELEQQDDSPPEWKRLPIWYWKRHRGVLVLLSVAGFAAFWFPWVHVTIPENVKLTGADMAEASGWIWAYAVAWFMMAASVLSRRTIMQMRGARVATGLFAAIAGMTIGILAYKVPKGGIVPVVFTFQPAFYAAGIISLVALPFALLFGGKPVADKERTP